MDCIYCNYPYTRIVDHSLKRNAAFTQNEVYRRRICENCKKRFTTREHMRDDYKRKVKSAIESAHYIFCK